MKQLDRFPFTAVAIGFAAASAFALVQLFGVSVRAASPAQAGLRGALPDGIGVTAIEDLTHRLDACRASAARETRDAGLDDQGHHRAAVPRDQGRDEAATFGDGAYADNSRRCTFVAYVASPSMPLSIDGVREIRAAGRALDLDVAVLDAEQLYDAGSAQSAQALVAAGATVHFPTILVYRDGVPVGAAIAGYKKADAYQALIQDRLAVRPALPGSPGQSAEGAAGFAAARARTVAESAERMVRDSVRDIAVDGRPGPYFRFVPGRNAIAYEADRTVYLLDLATGRTNVGPGSIDFVPSPDGALFVTPGAQSLEFYVADEVFREAQRGRGRNVDPVFVDRAMRDQYPSVGILSTTQGDGARTVVYRVLTSWYDRVAFRDYEVVWHGDGERPEVRPLRAAVTACRGMQISLPIMSQSGHELAARDESSASTKIFRLADDGTCTEEVDLALQSGKVAWSARGDRVAFAIPDGIVRDGSGRLWDGRDQDASTGGIFVFDRAERAITRVTGSDEVSRLAFPEFVQADTVMFLLSAPQRSARSRFRLSCCSR